MARLESRSDAGGLRHTLDGRDVHAGDELELVTDEGRIVGRYEWAFDPTSPPRLVVGITAAGDELAIVLPPTADLEWPS